MVADPSGDAPACDGPVTIINSTREGLVAAWVENFGELARLRQRATPFLSYPVTERERFMKFKSQVVRVATPKIWAKLLLLVPNSELEVSHF